MAMKTQEQIKQLLNDYIVVRPCNEEDETTLRVTFRKYFEEMNYCKCFSEYGQQIGCYNAGCYSLQNNTSDAMKDLIAAIEEKFDVTPDIVEYVNNNFKVEPRTDIDDELRIEIDKFIKEWRKENEYHTKATAWTFFDSHNYRSVTLKTPDNPNCKELDEEEQIAILSEMPKLPYHVAGTEASEKTENYTFYFDRWANNPWICFVEKNDN